MAVDPVKLSTLALAILSLLVAGAAPAQDASRVRLPLFDLETPGHSLQLEVTERTFAEEEATVVWSERAAILGDDPTVRLETAAAAYLDVIVTGDLDRLETLVAPSGDVATVRRQTRLLGKAVESYTPLERVRFLRAWRFGGFREVLLEVTSEIGRSKVFALGFETVGGRSFVRGDWGAWQPMHLGFWYLARNFSKGWMEDHAPRDFRWTLEIEADVPAHPVGLSFDGTLYDQQVEWTSPAADAAPTSASGLLRRTLAVAAVGEGGGAFPELFAPSERAEILRIRSESPPIYRGLRDSLAVRSRVKDLLTADLGDFLVHYWIDEQNPTRVRVLVLRREDGRLWISRELYSNVEALMTSDLVEEPVLALWRAGA